jgi:hypothetical protein
MEYKYDVALSYASEEEQYVDAVAIALRAQKVKVFYDRFFSVDLWGKDLVEELDEIYRKQSKYVVIFISRSYAAKMWTKHELRSALARALEQDGEYVLPARFDDTELKGVRPTTKYQDLTNVSPQACAELIQAKLRAIPADALRKNWTKSHQSSDRSDIGNDYYRSEIERYGTGLVDASAIVAVPHWHLVVRPSEYAQGRVSNIRQLKELVEKCKVYAGNWEMPLSAERKLFTGNDWISGIAGTGSSRELWQIFQSAQFVLSRTFREENFSDKIRERVSGLWYLRDADPTGFREIFHIVRYVLLSVEFCAKYAQELAVEDLQLGVFMRRVRGNVLFFMDIMNELDTLLQTQDDLVGGFWALSTGQIENHRSDLEKEMLDFLFQRFGLFNEPKEMEDIIKFVKSGGRR